MNQLSERYLEDFAMGQTFGSGRLRIDGERALAFAAEFDPQPFHLDQAAARRSIFGGLTASGWHAKQAQCFRNSCVATAAFPRSSLNSLLLPTVLPAQHDQVQDMHQHGLVVLVQG